jgi:hypothetical protein
MAVPLDEDGFLRRQCPNCEREFKWRPTPDGEDGDPMPESGYACPYCAERAPGDHWWTRDQLEHAERLVASEIVAPRLKRLERNAVPGKLFSLEVRVDTPSKPEALPDEPNDMQRVDFPCHPTEPVKVLDDWSGRVHCLICAAPIEIGGGPG